MPPSRTCPSFGTRSSGAQRAWPSKAPLNVSLGFSPPFGEGDLLALKHHSSVPYWMNEWFTLREATEALPLLLGGVNADSLLPISLALFWRLEGSVESMDQFSTPMLD